MDIRKILAATLAAGVALTTNQAMAVAVAKDVIHDAEHYVLLAQHKDKWAAQDKTLEQKLAKLEAKHGKRPNIIHIMWDDTGVGEIGIPAIQKVRGWETPNMNQLAAAGINFMRMYTEPGGGDDRPSRQAQRYVQRGISL